VEGVEIPRLPLSYTVVRTRFMMIFPPAALNQVLNSCFYTLFSIVWCKSSQRMGKLMFC